MIRFGLLLTKSSFCSEVKIPDAFNQASPEKKEIRVKIPLGVYYFRPTQFPLKIEMKENTS